ncbi:hypothetical protein [Hyperthermus butylicus]|uniref:Uncharacterized protein n=1 Tax=Hyperthermus butylicus (strain DSM 5456 / JCM 9403 / PLM1-5) TaxID=415426 RepID=A2BJD3_HYPBU|nr:hypothetical protein [Hyperthermus butylicus]ABM80094.1 hypothetical protein Hbut_0222 [Hyperthermus butylicus DSM 5456]
MSFQSGRGVRRIVLVLGGGRGIVQQVLALMAREAARGYRGFELHVFTTRPRPDYMETVRGIILNNIAYSLRVWYHGADTVKLREIVASPDTAVVVDETADEELKQAAMEAVGVTQG